VYISRDPLVDHILHKFFGLSFIKVYENILN